MCEAIAAQSWSNIADAHQETHRCSIPQLNLVRPQPPVFAMGTTVPAMEDVSLDSQEWKNSTTPVPATNGHTPGRFDIEASCPGSLPSKAYCTGAAVFRPSPWHLRQPTVRIASAALCRLDMF